MKISGYNLDFEDTYNEIKKNNYSNILIQIPEGLKTSSKQIIDEFEKNIGFKPLINGDPCYGSCDLLCPSFLKSLDIDTVVHIGHTKIPNLKTKKWEIPILYVNTEFDKDISTVTLMACEKLIGKNIGIVTTTQHSHKINQVKEILKSNGFNPVIGIGDNRISFNGQILGCNFSSGINIIDEIDSYIFIGSGNFHPIGLLLATKKPVIAADPYMNKVKTDELIELKDMILRQRYAAITYAKTAKTYGILTGLKPGQQRIKQVERIKNSINEKNKEYIEIAISVISPIILEGFTSIDCFINTLCPRITIDDYQQYKKTIITPIELEIVFGKRHWDDYIFDQIV
jgi:2-(3-amino-3-carboxypropyl)histidine synthase